MTAMRFTAIAVLCLMVAVAAFLCYGGDVVPAPAPANLETYSTPANAPRTASNTSDSATESVTREQAQTQSIAPAIPKGADVIRGRLLQEGQPLVGAKVGTWNGDPATSGSDGSFALAMPPSQWRITLEVKGTTIPRGVKFGPVEMQGLKDRNLGDLHLPRAVSVTGRAVDPQGHGLADVRVYATRGRFVDGVMHDAPRANLSTLSDTNGVFRIDGLRPGKVRVRAILLGHGSQQPDVEVSRGVGDVGLLVVTKYADLTGTVVDTDGQPIGGASVCPGGGTFGLEKWATTETDTQGQFVLVGRGKGWSLTVTKYGYTQGLFDSVYSMPRPLRLTLATARPMQGRVLGAVGKDAVFYVDVPEDDYRSRPDWVRDYDFKGQPIAANGTFSLPDLPSGKWVIRVRAPGHGSVPNTPFVMPQTEPLELQLKPDRSMGLTLIDNTGATVPDAEVRRINATVSAKALEKLDRLALTWFRWPRQDHIQVDEQGHTTILAPISGDICLAVRAPMHLPTAEVIRKDAVPAEHTITLRRGGFLFGCLKETKLCQNVQMSVAVKPVGEDERLGAVRLIDATGQFRIGPLLPGIYEIGIALSDMTHFIDRKLPVAKPVPLVHGYGFANEVRTVQVVAGEEVEVVLPAPQVSELRGRVLAGARPVQGVLVYVEEVQAKGERDLSFGRDRNGLDEHENTPNTHTDELGRYRFLISKPRTIRIRARRESSSGWSPPLQQTVSPQHDIDLPDIRLPASTIRGHFNLTAVETKMRPHVEAQLYPLEKAADDPFYHGDWGTSLAWNCQRQSIGVTGGFAFEGVPPGTWVLRIQTGYQEIAVVREITIAADDLADLGQLQLPVRVQPQLRGGLPRTHGVWLRRATKQIPGGIHLATLATFGEGRHLPALPPGKYLLIAFQRGAYFSGDSGVTGTAVGKPIQVEVHADGTTTPAVVWPNGL